MSDLESYGAVVYSDGACSGNPGPGAWAFACCLIKESRVIERVGVKNPTTNNQMELLAALKALQRCEQVEGKILILTDSKLLLNGMTQWLKNWKRNAWTKADRSPVLNRDLWEALDSQVAKVGAERVEWRYVPGHSTVLGNNRVDELAVAASKDPTHPLEMENYNGSLKAYPLAEMFKFLPQAESMNSQGAPKKIKGAAYYLSLVDGKLERHKSWPDCEARVKGRRNARYKKVSSLNEEKETLQSWNYREP